MATRVVGMATRLLVVPLSLEILGAERYGLWASVWSLMTWFSLSEGGIGVGLLNAVGRAKGRDERGRIRGHVATAAVLLLAMGVVVASAAAAFAAWGPVPRLLGVAGRVSLTADARAMTLAAGLVIAATLAASVVPQTLSALQEQYRAAAATMAASVGVLLSLAALAAYGRASPALFALGVGLPSVLACVVQGSIMLARTHRELRFGWRDVSLASVREVWGTGGLAFAIQLGDMAILQSANVLIAHALGPAAVSPYAVSFSVFYAGMCFVNYFVQPLWAAYAEAWARGDRVWIRARFARTFRLVVGLMSLGGLGMIVVGRTIIRVWAGAGVVPTLGLLVAMAVYFVAWTANNCVGAVASGLGLFGYRAISVVAAGAVFVVGSSLGLPRIGSVAIPLAGTLVMVIEGAVAWSQVGRRLARDASAASSGRPGMEA